MPTSKQCNSNRTTLETKANKPSWAKQQQSPVNHWWAENWIREGDWFQALTCCVGTSRDVPINWSCLFLYRFWSRLLATRNTTKWRRIEANVPDGRRLLFFLPDPPSVDLIETYRLLKRILDSSCRCGLCVRLFRLLFLFVLNRVEQSVRERVQFVSSLALEIIVVWRRWPWAIMTSSGGERRPLIGPLSLMVADWPSGRRLTHRVTPAPANGPELLDDKAHTFIARYLVFLFLVRLGLVFVCVCVVQWTFSFLRLSAMRHALPSLPSLAELTATSLFSSTFLLSRLYVCVCNRNAHLWLFVTRSLFVVALDRVLCRFA